MDINTTTEKNSNTDIQPNENRYWQSLEEWRQDAEFQKLADTEFLSSPLREASTGEGGWARREFLKLMGASLALTSFGCVRRPAQKIVPYVERPKDIIEGLPNYYASSFVDGGEVFGIVVATREGRPLHVSGNEKHAINKGGMSARAQAHVLSLYDPARLTHPVKNLFNEGKTNYDTVRAKYENIDKEIVAQIKKGKVGVLTGSVVSPSLRQLLNEFKSSTNAKSYTWEPLSHEAYTQAQELSYGSADTPRLVLENAKYILSVQNDFLGTFLNPTEQARAFASRRRPGNDMNRLVVIESLLSLTGTNSDERFTIRPSDGLTVLMGLLHELLVVKKISNYANDSAVLSILRAYEDAETVAGLEAGTLSRLAGELASHRGQSLVLAGSDLASQVAAALLNSVLGNDGVTLDTRRAPNMAFKGTTADLKSLVEDLNAGRIQTLIIHGVNPVYSGPVSLGFTEAVKKAETVIYTGESLDETARVANYILPDHHPMEAWSDVEGQKGVYSIQQPTIEPLYDTRSFGDSLIALAKVGSFGAAARHESFYDLVHKTALERSGLSWTQFLQEGAVDKSGNRLSKDSGRSFRSQALKVCERKDEPRADAELVLYATVGLRDGHMANVPWLQEFPDPVTKICWDNYFTVSIQYASERKLKQGQLITVSAGDKAITAPVHIQPGQDHRAIGLAVGYGRSAVGPVGNNVGVNAYTLMTEKDGFARWSGIPVSVDVSKRTISPLANTQGHNYMSGKTAEGIDIGRRQIVVEATLEDWKQKPDANIRRPKMLSAWSGHEYKGHKWGMSVDLNLCTGCSACVIACQSENNVPTVGKTFVLQGRVMHWIRLDRYYVGEPESPDTVYMPVMCQHCDNAPCETVCPVLATVHSTEGLNEMIYNRCVGTRYCANNCPYKVRRFNWFNYAKQNPHLQAEPMHMQRNPEVTVRSRGVMEKCTFCTHRIQQAKSKAKLEDRSLRDGDIVTACQSACPTGAIIFGDVNDPESRVSREFKDQRYYGLLEELNTRPAVQYASKIRNTAQLKITGQGMVRPEAGKGGS